MIGERCVDGFKQLELTAPSGPMYHYKQATNESLGDQPLLGS